MEVLLPGRAVELPAERVLSRETGCGLELMARPCHALDRACWADRDFPGDDLCKSDREAVFVVEDCDAQREEIVEVVVLAGYRAVGCRTSADLQNAVKGYSTGCILLDIRIPGLDGVALQDWLATSQITLPVVFMTGLSDVDTAVRCMKHGALDFLRKPVQAHSLRDVVSEATGLSRLVHCTLESSAEAERLLDRLTPTERKVAQMVAAGYSTKGIASALDRSENTVKIHRHRVFDKLSVVSPVGVAHIIRQAGESGARLPVRS